MDTNNGIDLGNAFDWLGKSEVPADTATTETAQTADDKAPLDAETAEESKPETKVESESPKTEETPTDESPALPQIVDDLGGEDAARQFIPLVRAIQEVAEETDERVIGTKLDDAIRGLLTPEQYSQFSFKLYDKYGQFFTEQFLADNPDWLKQQGYAKASGSDDESSDDDLFDDTETESPQIKQLQAQLAQQQTEINNLRSKTQAVEAEKAQQSEVQVVEAAKTAMLGSVVDRVFADMGWETAEIQQAARLALANFQNDGEAVKAFRQGVEYQKTQQALLKGSQVKASKAFERYLAEAIEFVDSKRTKALGKKEPVPPARKEILSTTPGANNSQQPNSQQNGANGNNPFDPNMLMRAVEERLRSKGAAARQ